MYSTSLTKNGIVCEGNGKKVCLDPRNGDKTGINFVSHAHYDHLPSKNGGVMLASNETSSIACLRGFTMEEHTTVLDGFSMHDSGHVLGSRGLLFDDVYYTGDICTRDRGFLKGAKVQKCHTLITECTFGLPEFIFPSIEKIKKHVNEIISKLYGKGIPVILLGYQLGKSQTLTQLFGHWRPLYLHDSVKIMNDLHRDLGVLLPDGMSHGIAEKNGLLEKKPWLMVAPASGNRKFIQDMKSKYGAVTIGFSGWNASTRFPYARQADYLIPFSDHCDFAELVKMVKQSGAQQVYTVHGFVKEFADHLKTLDISAEPLIKK